MTHLFRDLNVNSLPEGKVIWVCIVVLDIGTKSILYLVLNPFINISRYSYVDEEIYERLLGRVKVVPLAILEVTSKYSTIGFTNDSDSRFILTAEADVKSTTEPDTVNEPVITASPSNGKGVVVIIRNFNSGV
jgi:hypothetical protein